MNMQGFIAPKAAEDFDDRESHVVRLRTWLHRRRMLLLIVVLPTLLVAAYYWIIASDQYVSEAHYLVRATATAPAPTTGISQILSAASGLGSAQSESMSVADYLSSHDVVDRLQREINLVGLFQRSGTDVVSRLRGDQPTPERLLSYYRGQVAVKADSETGITTLRVRAFRPEDSYLIIEKLLKAGEDRVNILNERSYTDTLAEARRQLGEVEQQLAISQSRLTRFRQVRNDIDPQSTGTAQIGLVSRLTQELAAARAQLIAMGQAIDHSSPQYIALAGRVQALQGQVAAQSGRLVGGGGAIASDIGGYEELKLRQDFLAKRYEAAAANLDRARDQAQRQQLYLVRVVQPNMPVKALYPQRWRIVGTVFAALLLVYAIGWLIAAGVREHAA